MSDSHQAGLDDVTSEDRMRRAALRTEVIELFADHISRGQMRYLRSGHMDVLEDHPEGIGFIDACTGRPYVDCFTSAGCFNVGRRMPAIRAALDAALDDGLDLGTWPLVSPMQVELAERLARLAPGDLNRVIFCSGGGDAIDCALKLARAATQRPHMVAMVKAYHGHVGLALSANGKEHYRGPFEPLAPDFSFVPINDFDALADAVSERTAAVILEPVQGEAGIFVAEDEYLRRARALCDERGALLIFDEIQTGFGRTGRMFAAEHSGVVPDAMTIAKSLAGSLMPNAAVLYRDTPLLTDYVAREPWFHVSLMGGSDLGCRVSLAVLDQLERNRLWENAEMRGAELIQALESIRAANPSVIKEVRGRGLMVGVEYIHEFMGPLMSDALSKQGLLAAYSGNAPQVMRFMLPLTITQAEMADVIARIGAAVDSSRWMLALGSLAAYVPGVLPLLNDELVQTQLFGALRYVEDAAIYLKEWGLVFSEKTKDWVQAHEPHMQRAVGAMVEAGEAVERKAGPYVRPALKQSKAAARAAAQQTARAAARAGSRLPSPIRDAGTSAGVAAGKAISAVPAAARKAVSSRGAAIDAARRAPAAARSVARRVPAAGRQLGPKVRSVAEQAPGAMRKAAKASRDPQALGAAAGAAAGKLMDAAAAGTDAVVRGAKAAQRGPQILDEALRRDGRGVDEEAGRG